MQTPGFVTLPSLCCIYQKVTGKIRYMMRQEKTGKIAVHSVQEQESFLAADPGMV